MIDDGQSVAHECDLVVVDSPKDPGGGSHSTPLPRVPMACLFAIQLNEALQINVLYPFLVFMIELFGFTGSSLGVHAGVLASSFCGAQIFSSWLWGRMSDNVGLKPCLIIGTFGSAIVFFLFGLSTSFEQAAAARFCAGLLNGNIGMIKVFVARVTDESNKSQGFSFMSLAWGVGTCIAPVLGGLLSSPAETWPSTFEDTVFEKHPFFLPCACVGTWGVIAACALLFVLEEPAVPSNTPVVTAAGEAQTDDDGGRLLEGAASVRDPVAVVALDGTAHKTTKLPVLTTRPTARLAAQETLGEGRGGVAKRWLSGGGAGTRFSRLVDNARLHGHPRVDQHRRGKYANANHSNKPFRHGRLDFKGPPPPRRGERASFAWRALSSQDISEEEDKDDNEAEEDEGDEDEEENRSPQALKGTEEHGRTISAPDPSNEQIDGVVPAAAEAVAAPIGAVVVGCGDESEAGGEGKMAGEGTGPGMKNRAEGAAAARGREEGRLSGVALLLSGHVLAACASYGLLAITQQMLDEALPLFMKLGTTRGGLGFEEGDIGALLAVGGVPIVASIVFVPAAERRFGAPAIFKAGVAAVAPIGTLFWATGVVRPLLPALGNWALLGTLVFVKNSCLALAFSGVFVMMSNSVPSDRLGEVNGFGQTLASLSRAAGPSLCGALWSLSTRWHFVPLSFLGIGACCAACLCLAARLPASLRFAYGSVGATEQYTRVPAVSVLVAREEGRSGDEEFAVCV